MIQLWHGLDEHLQRYRCFELTQKDLALQLLGKDARDQFIDPVVGLWMAAHLQCAGGQPGRRRGVGRGPARRRLP